jgi:hypothetical protein
MESSMTRPSYILGAAFFVGVMVVVFLWYVNTNFSVEALPQ